MSPNKSAIAAAVALAMSSSAAMAAGQIEIFSYGFNTVNGAPADTNANSLFGDNIEFVTVSELWTDPTLGNIDTPVDLDGLSNDGVVNGGTHNGTTGLSLNNQYDWPGRRQTSLVAPPGADRILSTAATTVGPDGTVRGNRMVAYTTNVSLNHETELDFVVSNGRIFAPNQLFFAVYVDDLDPTDGTPAGPTTEGWVLAGANNDIVLQGDNTTSDFQMQIDTGDFPTSSGPGYRLMTTAGTFGSDEVNSDEAIPGNVVIALLDRTPDPVTGSIVNYSPIVVANAGLVADDIVTLAVPTVTSVTGDRIQAAPASAETLLKIVRRAPTPVTPADSIIDVTNVYLTSHLDGYSPGGDNLGGAAGNGGALGSPVTVDGAGGFEFVDPTQREEGSRTPADRELAGVGPNDYETSTPNVLEYTRSLVRRGFVINPSLVTGLTTAKDTGSPDRVSSQALVGFPNLPEYSFEITDSTAITDVISLIRVARPNGESVEGVTRVNFGGRLINPGSIAAGIFAAADAVNNGSIPELPTANGSTRLTGNAGVWTATNLDIGITDSTGNEPILDGSTNILEITVNDRNENQLIDVLDAGNNGPLHAGTWAVTMQANLDQDRNEPTALGVVTLIDNVTSHNWTINAARVKVPYIVINAGSLGFSSFIKVTNEGNTPAVIMADAVIFNRTTGANTKVTGLPVTTVAKESLVSINEVDLNAALSLDAGTIYQLGLTLYVKGSPDEVQITAFQKDSVGRTALPVYYDTDLRAFQQ